MPVISKEPTPPSLRYNGADLLEAFLCCFMDTQPPSSQDPRVLAAQAMRLQLGRRPLREPLNEDCSHSDLECCLAACAPSAPEYFCDETSVHLWSALKEALIEIEPMAARRGSKTIPRTLDHIWSLLEACALLEDSGSSDGAEGRAGSSKRI
jgi:hypothetical protein